MIEKNLNFLDLTGLSLVWSKIKKLITIMFDLKLVQFKDTVNLLLDATLEWYEG